MSVDLRQTSDDLWYHALQFLDEFRLQDTKVDRKEFYTHDNDILKKHEAMMKKKFVGGNARMRDMYIELIKMIFDEEQKKCPNSFMETLDIHKLQGYQELTNRLQRSLNLKLFQQQEVYLAHIEETEEKMQIHAAQLEAQAKTIDRLEALLKDLMDKDEVDSSALIVQKETLQVLEKRLDTNEQHINLLEDKDKDQDGGYESLRKEINELKAKDIYLEETNTLTANKVKDLEPRVETNETDIKELKAEDIKLGSKVNTNEEDIKELKAKDLYLEEAHKQSMNSIKELDEKLDKSVKKINEDIEDVEDDVDSKNKAIWKRLDELNEADLKVEATIHLHNTAIQGLEAKNNELHDTDTAIIKRLDELDTGMNNIDVKIDVANGDQTKQLEANIRALAEKIKQLEGISNENAEVINQHTLNQLSMGERINNEIHVNLGLLEEKMEKKVDNLRPEFATLVEEIQPQLVKTLEDKLHPVNEDVEFLKENLKEKDKDIAKQALELKIELEGSKAKIEQGYDEAIGRLEAGLLKNSKDIEDERKNLGDLAEQVKEHNVRIGKLEDREKAIQDLNEKLNELDDKNHKVLDRTNSLEDNLRKEIVDLAQAKDSLQDKLDNVDGRSLDNLENIVALKEFNNNKAEEATQLQISIQNIEAEKQQSVASLEKELEKAGQDTADKLAALEKIVGEQGKDLVNHDDILGQHKDQLEALRKADKDLKEEHGGILGQHKDELEALRQADKDLKDKHDATLIIVVDAEKKLGQLKDRADETDKDIEGLKGNIQSLVSEDQAIWKKIDEIVNHDVRDQVKKLREDLIDFDEKNKELLQSCMDEDHKLNLLNDNLRKELEELKKDHGGILVQHTDELEALRKADKDLKDKHDATLLIVVDAEKKLGDLKDRADAIDKEIEQLKGNVHTLSDEDKAIWKKIEDIITHDVRDEVKKIKDDLLDFDEKNKELLQSCMDEDHRLHVRIEEVAGEMKQASADTEGKIREQLALTIELFAEKSKEDNNDRFNIFQTIIDDKIHEVDTLNDKNNKHVENLRDLNEKLLEEIKNAVVSDVDNLKENRIKVDADLGSLEERLDKLGDNVKSIEDNQQEMALTVVLQQTKVLQEQMEKEIELKVNTVDEGFGERLTIVEGDIKILGKGNKDLQKQIDELEKADTFLQEANKIAMNKIQGVDDEGKKTLGIVDNMGSDIKSIRVEIEENETRLKEDLQKQTDEDNAIWKRIDELVEEDDKIKVRLDNIDSGINILKVNITDFDEKNKDLLQGIMDEENAIKARIDNLDVNIKNFDVKIELIQEEEKKQGDHLKEDVEVKIHEIEVQGKKNEDAIKGLEVSYDDLEVKMVDKIEKVDEKQADKVKELQKVVEDLGDGRAKLEKAIEILKPEIVEVVEEKLGGQIEKIVEEKVRPVLEKEHVLEEKLDGMKKVIEEVKEDVKGNDTDLDKKAEEIAVRIDDIIVKEQTFEKVNNNLQEDLDRLKDVVGTLTKELKDNEDDIEENEESLEKLKKRVDDLDKKTDDRFLIVDANKKQVDEKIHDCDERIKDNLEQIVALKEADNTKKEESNLLMVSINKLENEKQQSDADHRDQLENHSKQLQEVQDELKKRVANNEVHLDRHDKQIEELQKLQKDDGLAKRVDKLEEFSHALQEDQHQISNEVKVQDKKLNGVKSNLDDCRGDLSKLEDTTKNNIQRLVDEDQAIWQKLDQLEVKDKQLTEQCQDSQEQIQGIHRDIEELRRLLEDLKNKLKSERDVDEDELKRLRDAIDDKLYEMTHFTDKNGKIVEDLRDLNEKLLIEIKNTVGVDVDDLKLSRENLEKEMGDLMIKIIALEKALKDMEGKESEEALNIVIQQTNVLKESLEKEMKAQINVVDEGFSERLTKAENDVVNNKDAIEVLKDAIDGEAKERQEGEKKVKKEAKTLNEGIRMTNKSLAQQEQSFWTLILEIYGALRGFTVLLKSSGKAREEQSRCMGVYRVVDHLNDRPLYRQDDGDHFLYWNPRHVCWMVSGEPDSDFGWIRNDTSDQQLTHHIPDLQSGWVYQPLAREDHMDAHWRSDDASLHVEILRDVDIIKKTITDIKNAREVD